MTEELVLVPKYKYDILKERADDADSVKDEKPSVKWSQDKSNKNSLLQLQSKNSVEKNQFKLVTILLKMQMIYQAWIEDYMWKNRYHS